MNYQEELPGLAIINTPSKKTNMNESLASSKQVEFILSLATSRYIKGHKDGHKIQDIINEVKAGIQITKPVASDVITVLLTSPKLPANAISNPRATTSDAIDVGYYKSGTRVFKAVRSPQTGNMYTKELHATGWEYLTGGINYLKNHTHSKLTLDEAKDLGKIYGFCVACGRTLTDEKSISAGIGPICSSKF